MCSSAGKKEQESTLQVFSHVSSELFSITKRSKNSTTNTWPLKQNKQHLWKLLRFKHSDHLNFLFSYCYANTCFLNHCLQSSIRNEEASYFTNNWWNQQNINGVLRSSETFPPVIYWLTPLGNGLNVNVPLFTYQVMPSLFI